MNMIDRTRLAEVAARVFPDRPAPVGIARVDTLPPGATLFDGPLTSACQLWRLGTERVVAAGSDHGACVIGLLTQGFADGLPANDPTVGAMLEVEYIDPAEVALLPRLPRGHAAIVYGPLAELPVDPEAILWIATPVQTMLLGEALGLMTAGGGGIAVTGRPTCAAIPAAIAASQVRGSTACSRARVYAGLSADEMILVVPAIAATSMAGELERLARANVAVDTLARRNLAALGAA